MCPCEAEDTLLFLNRVKWLQLDHLIVELERILEKYQLSSLLLHINCSPERLSEEPRVTQPVGDLGYFREQIVVLLTVVPVLFGVLC